MLLWPQPTPPPIGRCPHWQPWEGPRCLSEVTHLSLPSPAQQGEMGGGHQKSSVKQAAPVHCEVPAPRRPLSLPELRFLPCDRGAIVAVAFLCGSWGYTR